MMNPCGIYCIIGRPFTGTETGADECPRKPSGPDPEGTPLRGVHPSPHHSDPTVLLFSGDRETGLPPRMTSSEGSLPPAPAPAGQTPYTISVNIPKAADGGKFRASPGAVGVLAFHSATATFSRGKGGEGASWLGRAMRHRDFFGSDNN